MGKVTYDHIQETLYKKKLSNGLSVYLLPKQSITKSFGVFMTNYGSIDNHFIPIDGQKKIKVPDGIAHFLEHKLFEKKDYDVFSHFMRQGASPNAYTSFTKTAYLFSTTKNVAENVTTLLDFVQEPFFSDESVEKEKGIIAQEIKMYDDQADWRSYMGTVQNMYERLPVNIDIAGTVASIEEITKEDLYTCYHTFYHPENMVLFVTGNFEAESLMQTIEHNQSTKKFLAFDSVQKSFPEEPQNVAKKESILHLPVSIPKVTIGIKESKQLLNGEQLLRRELLQQMVLDYLFSPSGIFYEPLYEEQLIDDSFEFSTTVEEHFNFSMIGSNTKHPEKFRKQLKELLLRTNTIEIDAESFATMKKKRIGEILRAMNSLEHIANQYVHYHFASIDYFKVIPFIQTLTVEDVNTFLKEWITEDRLTICTIIKE